MNISGEHLEEYFIRKCIELAKISKTMGESPVGSVVVKNNEIIGKGTESVKAKNDLSFHSEIEAIRDACNFLGHRNLSDCVLYTTHEPCIMCSYIIRQTGIGKVVFSISSGEIGGFNSHLPVLCDQTVSRWQKPPLIIGGVLEKECRELLG